MKDPRIVFMGTPDFAVATLDALLQAKKNIVAVITAPDKPAGRGRKINQSAVKKYAVSKDIKVLQPKNLKDNDFLHELSALEADLQIVVAFRMLPKQVWAMPRLGTFNLHASLLPDYRGAAPINWAIINGENKTGVTTFFLNEDIDTGDIIQQETLSISENTTAGELHDQLMALGSKTVVETVDSIMTASIKPIQQKAGSFKPAPKLTKENCRINWNESGPSIYNHIRGLNPYPGAWTVLDNDGDLIELKIYDSQFKVETHDFDIGHLIVSKKQLSVAIENGILEIKDLKLAGKRRMDVLSLLNGYQFHKGSKMF